MQTVSDKQVEKAKKQLDAETVSEMLTMDEAALERVIVEANQAVAQAQTELEANPKYTTAKEAIKDLSQGLKEVRKRQNNKVTIALHLLESKGKI